MHIKEQADQIRAHNTFRVFNYCQKNMPQPLPSRQDSPQFHLSVWHHRYIVHEGYQPENGDKKEFKECSDAGSVIVLKTAKRGRNGRAIEDMRKVYQLLVTNEDRGTRMISYRHIQCWCIMCSQYLFDQCVMKDIMNTGWKKINLQKREQRI